MQYWTIQQSSLTYAYSGRSKLLLESFKYNFAVPYSLTVCANGSSSPSIDITVVIFSGESGLVQRFATPPNKLLYN